MDVESLAKQLILQNMTPEQQNAVLESVRASLQEARSNQKRRVSENVGMVVDALKKIEADIRAKYDDLGGKIEARVNSIRDGRDGADGRDGKDGRNGRDGKDGAPGPMGPAGRDGRDGLDGQDGVSVIDAKIDFDGSLVITLSNGREINVGEVVAADVAEKIRVLTYGGGNGGGGTPGLTYKGTWNASTNTPTLTSSVGTNGDYYIVSTAGSTDLNGITDWQPGDWAIFNGTVWQKIDQSWATAGVNNNITSMTGIAGGISSPDFIQFDTTATVTDATGKLYYDNADQFQTLAFQMNGSVVQHIGESQFYRVKCSGSITAGQVVMFAGTLGASGGLIGAAATGLTPEQSNYIIGVAAESGVNNDWITVLSFGQVKNIDTTGGAENWSQGDILYYNPLVTGGLTKTKPTTPAAIAVIAAVVYVSSTAGVLFVRPTYGSVLGGTDGNVNFTSLASGNTLIYDAVAGVWENANLTDGTGISITEGPGSITIANTGVTSAIAGTGISVSGSTGAVTITNTAPDQTVSLTGAGTTSVTGTYPNFTVTSNDQYVGTVTSVSGTGTVNGLTLSGTVTSSGSLTLGGSLSGTASLNIDGTVGATTPNTGSFTSLTDSGNLTFTGTSNRITGDFSNATIANRVMFQTSTTNGISVVSAIPNGTAVATAFNAFNNSDPTNAARAVLQVNNSEVTLSSGITGTGTYLPMTFYTSGSEKLRIAADTTGTITIGGTAPRITGDFSNATQSNIVSFQTSTTNAATSVSAIPNGTNNIAAFSAFNSSSPNNSSYAQFYASSSTVTLASDKLGTGTYLPMTFVVSGSERVRIDTSGNLLAQTATGFWKLPAGTTAQRATGATGALRFNTDINRFEGYNGSTWGTVGGGATGGGTDEVFVENGQTVTTNYTISSGKSAMSAGPITINSGVTVTVPSGSRWVVV